MNSCTAVTPKAMALQPFALSLSKRSANQGRDFDKLSPNGQVAG